MEQNSPGGTLSSRMESRFCAKSSQATELESSSQEPSPLQFEIADQITDAGDGKGFARRSLVAKRGGLENFAGNLRGNLDLQRRGAGDQAGQPEREAKAHDELHRHHYTHGNLKAR